MTIRIKPRYMKMAEMYKLFAEDIENIYDFSVEALEEMYLYESRGIGKGKVNHFTPRENWKYNGYCVGKHWMDVTIAMWVEDLESGLLQRYELERDFPEWFLKKVGIL